MSSHGIWNKNGIVFWVYEASDGACLTHVTLWGSHWLSPCFYRPNFPVPILLCLLSPLLGTLSAVLCGARFLSFNLGSNGSPNHQVNENNPHSHTLHFLLYHFSYYTTFLCLHFCVVPINIHFSLSVKPRKQNKMYSLCLELWRT